jgi:hypothetical protein
MRLHGTLAAAASAAGAMAAALLTGCGSTPATLTSGPHPAPDAILPIATSLADPAGASWAVLELGGSSARHANFWELFVRPAGAAGWKLATPAGVASNGGLIVAGGGPSLVAGFRPSQLLTFSPLAATTDQGSSWSQRNLISPGLAGLPDALAAGPGGQLLALTGSGTVALSPRPGASWRSVISRNALARSTAGQACGLTSLSAAAFSAAGLPMVGGTCRKPGHAALFSQVHGSWQPVSLALPAALGHAPVSVLGLTTISGRTTALLAAGHGANAGIVAAWTGGTGSGSGSGSVWTFSPVLRAGPSALDSLSLWPGGSAGLVLGGSRAETIAGPGASWQQLPALPARTATLALGQAGQLEALAGHGGTLTAWQLGAGAGVTPAGAGTGPASWTILQTVKVQIPYGSSG